MQRLLEDERVGDVDDPAGALVGVDPVADFHQDEFEQVDVDHVPGLLADLDSVAEAEGLSPDDENPAEEIAERVFERDGKPGGDQPQIGGQLLRIFQPDCPKGDHC